MRRLYDRHTKETMSRAKALEDELGYTKEQVGKLRELFNNIDVNLSGGVDIGELSAMFTGLVEMDTYAEQELEAFLQKHSDAERNPNEIDFAGFLKPLKDLETRNWHNVVSLASCQVNIDLQEQGRRRLSAAARKKSVPAFTMDHSASLAL